VLKGGNFVVLPYERTTEGSKMVSALDSLGKIVYKVHQMIEHKVIQGVHNMLIVNI
jgi:hypothetical protein